MSDPGGTTGSASPARRRVLWIIGGLSVALVAVIGVGLADRLRGDDESFEPNPPREVPRPTGQSNGVRDFAIDPAQEPTVPALDVSEQYVWAPRPIGGGGWVKGVQIHPSGSPMVARTDVGGAYRWDPVGERWIQLLYEDAVADPVPGDYQVESVAISESDPDRIYLTGGQWAESDPEVSLGRVLASSDGGRTWTGSQNGFVIFGNGDGRNGGERLAVSTTDPDVVWFGGAEGLFRSDDGAATFTAVDTTPEGVYSVDDQTGVEWIATDDGAVYVGVAGSGVHRSTDEGATWEQLWAFVERPFDPEIDDNGVLWELDADGDTLRRYDPATGAVEIIDGFTSGRGLGVSADGRQVVISRTDGFWYSDNGGADWDRSDVRFSCPSLPWVEAIEVELFAVSSPHFDPVDERRVWLPQGWGVWTTADISAGTVEMECRFHGIEELVVNDLVAPAADELVVASWDRALFHLPAGGEATASPTPADRFNSSWDLATTAVDPQFVAATVADHRFCCEQDGRAYASGVSRDGGLTWERFESYDNGTHPETLRFGNIAVSASDTQNMVWLPTWNGALHYTVDGGATWVPVILPGTEDRLDDDGRYVGGSHFRFFLRREVLIADPVAPATFYLYHADLGMFRSTDGGATWELRSADGVPTGWTVGWFRSRLAAVPGVEGHLLYAPGKLVEGIYSMYESRDGGATWTAVPGTAEIDDIGFGAPVDGSDHPTVYVAGRINNVHGIHRSSDLTATWDLVGTTAGGIYARVTAITGDPEIPGRVYVGFSGNSVIQGDQPGAG